MRQPLYVPAYSAEVALTNYALNAGGGLPFYWFDPVSAQEVADEFYPGGRVFEIKEDNGRVVAREFGSDDNEAGAWVQDGVGDQALYAVIGIGAALVVLGLVFL